MPRRSNLFQEVVALIYHHMGDGAVVEESAMLPHNVTGELREIDVTITKKVAGHPLVISVEATAKGRRADTPWVESMLKKHENLPTNQLVLVSNAGFSAPAIAAATHGKAIALTPKDLQGEDAAYKIVNRIRSIWPKMVNLSIEELRVHVKLDGEPAWFRAAHDLKIFLDTGDYAGNLIQWSLLLIEDNWINLMGQIGVRDIQETTDLEFNFFSDPLIAIRNSERRPLYARYDAGPEPVLHHIWRLDIIGKAHIEVNEVTLSHQKLGDVSYAFGETQLIGSEAIVLVTENSDGGKLSIRLRDPAVIEDFKPIPRPW